MGARGRHARPHGQAAQERHRKGCKEILWGRLRSGHRRDGQIDIPSIDKPPIDKIDIDPSRQSAFFSDVMALDFEEIEPDYVVCRVKTIRSSLPQRRFALPCPESTQRSVFLLHIH